MSRNNIEDEKVRSLTLMGDGRSLGITIPIRYVRKFAMAPKQKVRIVRRGQNLVIQLDFKD